LLLFGARRVSAESFWGYIDFSISHFFDISISRSTDKSVSKTVPNSSFLLFPPDYSALSFLVVLPDYPAFPSSYSAGLSGFSFFVFCRIIRLLSVPLHIVLCPRVPRAGCYRFCPSLSCVRHLRWRVSFCVHCAGCYPA